MLRGATSSAEGRIERRAAAGHCPRSPLQNAARREPPAVGERVLRGPVDSALEFKLVQFPAYGALLKLKVAAFALKENLASSWAIPAVGVQEQPLSAAHFDDIELPVDRRDPAVDRTLVALQPACLRIIAPLGADNRIHVDPGRGPASFRCGWMENG
jgi:hypothetical protein